MKEKGEKQSNKNKLASGSLALSAGREGLGGRCKLFLCCLFNLAYFSDIQLLLYVSSVLSSLWLFCM
jgi:hypothetical protein